MNEAQLTLKKLTLDDISKLKPYLNGDIERTCDYTLGGVFIWRDYFDTHYTILDNTLILQNVYDGHTSFSVPHGENTIKSLLSIYRYCSDANIPTIFNTVTHTDLELLKSVFSVDVIEERNFFDYIYSAEKLSTFSGHKYNGQRNHINAFSAAYPDFKVLPITPQNIGRLADFMKNYESEKIKDSDVFYEELEKVHEVLSNNDKYEQEGISIDVGGKTVAFAMGETVGDTLYVHIEKALANVRGAYQMIVKEFVSSSLKKHNFQYVNREDDVGDEGLRRSKLSYHPIKMIEKYTVRVNDLIK